MENGFRVKVKDDFSINYEISDTDKMNLTTDFNKTFHKCRKMIDWFDDGNVQPEQKLMYFISLYNILESLHDMLKFMMAAGIKESEIIDELQLPF